MTELLKKPDKNRNITLREDLERTAGSVSVDQWLIEKGRAGVSPRSPRAGDLLLCFGYGL